MNNRNYRVMKFFEPVSKSNKARGYVRLDIRGMRGNIIVSAEGLGDVKSVSEVYLYKDRTNKLKLGDINNKKGMIKKSLTFGNNSSVEDYNTCAVVKDKKIVLYANLFNASTLEQVKKLEYFEGEDVTSIEVAEKLDNELQETLEKANESAEVVVPQVVNQESVDQSNEIKEDEIKKIVLEEQRIEQFEEKPIENLEVKKDDYKNENSNDRIKKESVSSAVNMNAEPIIETQSRKFKNKFDESLYYALKESKQVDPLSVKLKDFNWWYIPYDETGIKNGFLPYYNQIISSYYPYPISNRVTTCSGLMKKYGHYIFGIYIQNEDIVKFIYGVPGEFTKEEQPYKGITGFKNWSYSKKQDKEDYGYWLAFVNPKTGETTEPPEIVLS